MEVDTRLPLTDAQWRELDVIPKLRWLGGEKPSKFVPPVTSTVLCFEADRGLEYDDYNNEYRCVSFREFVKLVRQSLGGWEQEDI